MFECFIERVRQVVVDGQAEARKFKHNYIGTEHILLGLLIDEDGLAKKILTELGFTVEVVRGRVLEIVGEGDKFIEGQIPFTPRAKKIFEFALREALSLGHNYIGTEHVLLGLVRENEGVAARILYEGGLDEQKIRSTVLRELSAASHQPPAPGFKPRLRDLISKAKDLAIDEGKWEIAAKLRKIEKELGNVPDTR